MSSPDSVVSTLTSSISTYASDIPAIAGVALGVGAVVLLFKRGWGLIKDFTN